MHANSSFCVEATNINGVPRSFRGGPVSTLVGVVLAHPQVTEGTFSRAVALRLAHCLGKVEDVVLEGGREAAVFHKRLQAGDNGTANRLVILPRGTVCFL